MALIDTVTAHKNAIFISLGASALLLVAVGAFTSVKKVSPMSWGWYGNVNQTDGLALGGYDPVAYRAGGPTAGSAEHFADWDGATWRFVSAENKAAFTAEPEKFAPQFGGFCAFAASKGFTANTNPGVFAIDDDKLYVFDSADVRKDWLANVQDNRALSERSWATR